MMMNAVFAADAEIGSDAVFAADAEIGSDAVFAVDSGLGSDAVFAADSGLGSDAAFTNDTEIGATQFSLPQLNLLQRINIRCRFVCCAAKFCFAAATEPPAAN